MRSWINVITEAAGITVYHGGSGPLTSPIHTPFFTTPVIEMARSYAKQKGRGDGRITAFDLSPTTRIASNDDAEDIARELRIDWEGAHISDLFYSGDDYHELYDLAGAMVDQGFDAVLIHDFGYHSDFSEEPTYIIFNPAVLTNAVEIERVDSR